MPTFILSLSNRYFILTLIEHLSYNFVFPLTFFKKYTKVNNG